MATDERTPSQIIGEHLAAVRAAAEPEQEQFGKRFKGGSSEAGEPKLNGSELPLLLALLAIAESKHEQIAEPKPGNRPSDLEKAVAAGMDPLMAFWIEKPTKTGTLSKKISSTETFEQVYKRLVKWGWIVERHFNRKHYFRFEIGTVGER